MAKIQFKPNKEEKKIAKESQAKVGTSKHGIVQDCNLPSMAHSYVMFGMKLNSDLKRNLWAMPRGFSSHEEFKRLKFANQGFSLPSVARPTLLQEA